MASLEQNKALMRNYIEEAWNKGNLDFIDKNFSSEFVSHGTLPGQPTNRDGVKRVISTVSINMALSSRSVYYFLNIHFTT